nr:hypothetical protein Iba_chr11dCG5290 [Ipomoea batatas]
MEESQRREDNVAVGDHISAIGAKPSGKKVSILQELDQWLSLVVMQSIYLLCMMCMLNEDWRVFIKVDQICLASL